ncbi:MAG: hypothetical protein JW830_12810 [Bacteroidales bacterium]|nr:hypothetical protein [Bacteroidales bacterium]
MQHTQKFNTYILLQVLLVCLFLSCQTDKKSNKIMINYDTVPGTYGYDLSFLKNYQETVALSDTLGKAQVLIIPGWQARVMTSTANGPAGFSYGWINYRLIQSGKKAEHINAFGGEERLWLGPEGGQFSIYFSKGVKQEYSNWQVPAELDTMAFDLVSKSRTRAIFGKQFTLTNYSGTRMDIGIERAIELMDNGAIGKALGFELPDSVARVAYQSENVLMNNGEKAWTKETGMLSLWMLSMLTPSPGVTIIIPYRDIQEKQDEKILNDDYFGKVPSDRLVVRNGIIYFKADGKYRSKIGIPPQRAMNFSGSYDAKNRALTVLWCDLPEGITDYVNSKWEIQKDPFSGDAINAYNDGPVQDGTQMGPFYELESSSPAANLKPGEKLMHRQRIFHFEGSEDQLGMIVEKIFGISLDEVKGIFKDADPS